MLKVMYDYDGLAYTVVPCWITEDSRVHYCGAFATSRESWKRVGKALIIVGCLLLWIAAIIEVAHRL